MALLAFALAACGGGNGGEPDVGTPSRIELVGTVPATAVNAAVTPAPSVKLSDDAGRAVRNVEVTFAANGGGTMTGGTQRTNAQGIATVGSWRLGTIAGSGNTLTATAGSLTTTISAVANAGPASSHIRAAGQPDSQTVAPSTAVAVAPAVKVTDEFGNPIQGVIVTFAPSTGSGTVTGGLQTTNAQGVATVGSWTVGSAAGRQTLVASASGGLPPVTFIARVGATGNPCAPVAYALLSTVNGSLSTTDCMFENGPFLDPYRVVATAALNHEFRLSSPTMDTYMELWTPGAQGEFLAFADDIADGITNTALRFISPPVEFDLLATSFDVETGSYTLSSVNTPIPAGCGINTWVRPGIALTESIATTDCAQAAGTGGNSRGDIYQMILYPGRSTTVTLRSTAFDAFLTIMRAGTSAFVPYASDNNSGGGTDARVTIANTGTGAEYYLVIATTAGPDATGAYTIDLTPPGAPALVAAAPILGAHDGLLFRRRAPIAAPSMRAAKARMAAFRTR